MAFYFQEPLYAVILLLGAVLVFNLWAPATAVEYHRISTLAASLVALILGLLACLSFDKGVTGFQFTYILTGVWDYDLWFSLGADGFSMIFILLTLFIFPVLFLAAWNVVLEPKRFLNFLLAMELLLVLTFYTTDILYFFILFESLLIPMFILIGVWGARDRKIKAAYYFFLYTLFGSLFMLFGIFYLYFLTGSTSYYVLINSELDTVQQNTIWICFFIAFAVKMPLFPLHIWLPEAHVEAPTVGSMLLASLLLKLGGYGFLRFSLTFLSEASTKFAPLLTVSALLGVIYGALSTIRQIDLKRIIAYSSVSHMNLTMLGLFSRNQQGIEGAIYLMIAHGVVSAALFFCIGVLYDRHHSRLLRYYGGLVKVMPIFSAIFLAFSLANMGFPGTANFPGELGTFQGIFNENPTIAGFSTLAIVLGAVYSVWLYNRVAFGTLKVKYIGEFTDTTRREFIIGATLLLWMVALGVSAFYCLDLVHMAVKSLLAHKEVLPMYGPWWEGHQFDAPAEEIIVDATEQAAEYVFVNWPTFPPKASLLDRNQNTSIYSPPISTGTA